MVADKEAWKIVITNINLPQWLDQTIFDDLQAHYCCSCSNMTVIDWDKSNVLNYLGTYFPRSYTEAYCIGKRYLELHCETWKEKENISIFDFGCGTGGEIIGLLTAIEEQLHNIRQAHITALDGNQHALRLFEKIIKVYQNQSKLHVQYHIVPFEIDDFYDLSILDSVISQTFNIILSSKSVCEFVTKEKFEEQNAYKHITQSLLPKLQIDGIFLLTDVTTYNDVSQEWLPRMMDQGLAGVNCQVIERNEGYNQAFTVSHSKRKNDISKIAWRIINKKMK